MDLSILIPARNEQFLARTIEDILKHNEGDTEIIAVLDGAWTAPPIEDSDRVTLIYNPQPIGQRAATNQAARLSRAKYIMKCDAHCSFGQGFDVNLMAEIDYDWTVIPEQRNLHAFDWRCLGCGKQTYQGPYPTECGGCDNTNDFEMVMVWKPRAHTRNRHFRFDNTLHFQYWREYKKRPEARGQITDTMSLLGACWLMHRKRYWELGGCDEAHGSWGQMGTEIACKSQLSGGRLVCNRATWYAHLFRTQKGFGFPYPNPGVEKARAYSRWLWLDGNWGGTVHPLSWLLDKYWPVPDWTDEDLTRQRDRERHRVLHPQPA
jgi:glycosyltransferase involved in cell wall biosynthesis